MKPNVMASMTAYLIAQSMDVQVFHFWKLSILYVTGGLGSEVDSISDLLVLMRSSYAFKFVFALLDTPFFYLGVYLGKGRVTATEAAAA